LMVQFAMQQPRLCLYTVLSTRHGALCLILNREKMTLMVVIVMQPTSVAVLKFAVEVSCPPGIALIVCHLADTSLP